MRKPMVTRSFTTTKVTMLALDIVKGEPINLTYTLPRTYSDDEKLKKVVQTKFDTDTLKNVSIVDKVEETKLYGMSEETFLANAVELDAETRKAIEAPEEETEEAPEEVTEEAPVEVANETKSKKSK